MHLAMLGGGFGFFEMVVVLVVVGGVISFLHKIVEAVSEHAARKQELEKEYLTRMLHVRARLDEWLRGVARECANGDGPVV